MKSIREFDSLYIHRKPVDLRKSINGLSAIVQAEMRLDLRASSLFIFCNETRNRMKILYFDRSGFALWLKWLDQGKFPWPKNIDKDVITVSAKDLSLLLDGINIWSRFNDVHFETVL